MEKTIVLKKLELQNFKGKKHEVFEFKNESSLYGDNATGKTTVGADALPWLFFGKNSADETKFNVKTLDPSGVRIPNIETSVKGWFEINGVEEVFERVLFEKWTKKHGETTKEYTGDETKYFINAAPKKKKEFDAEVGAIISTDLFKLLSNPLEFNRLPWEKRREVLVKIVGEITDDKVLDSIITVQNKAEYNSLIFAINKTGVDVYKAELKGKINLHKKNLENIPSRIDEVYRGKPVVLDWDDLNGQIKLKTERIEQIDTSIANEAEKQREINQKQQELQKLIGQKQLDLQKLENDLKLEANKDMIKLKADKTELQHKLDQALQAVATNNEFIRQSELELNQFNNERQSLLAEYKKLKENEFTFDDSKMVCPTCKQSLPEGEIESKKETMLQNFNQTKANDIETNMKRGLNIKGQIEELTKKRGITQVALDELQTRVPELEKQIAAIDIVEKPVDFSMDKEWNDLHDEIEKLNADVKESKVVDNSELSAEKLTLQTEVKQLERQLNTKEEIEKADARIAELQKQQLELAQSIADLEKDESIVIGFEKTKMNMLEEKVNSMFNLVKFRMFEPQKNGGEKPDCVTLINGVPYSDANTASKINAGVDIINVLSEHYQTFVPIVIDNRESVTELLPVKSQIINLIKDENYKSLTLK